MAIPHVINEISHDTRYSLTHNNLFTSFMEIVRDGSGKVSSVIIWTSSAKTQKVRETILTRDVGTGAVTQVTKKQYDRTGTLVETLTSVVSRSGSQIGSLSITKT